MLPLFINLLTLVLVVVALFLGLLILLQLPKKEAGITAAFGAESTAALFGAGSGTALSNITKWSAGIFLGLCFVIAIMTTSESKRRSGGAIRDSLKTPVTAAAVPAAGNIPASAVAVSNPIVKVTNAVAPATNAAGK